MNIGSKLKKLRKEKALTLHQISQMTGVAKATLSRIENGKVGGNFTTLKKIADALHVSLDELMANRADAANMSEKEPALQLASIRKDLKDLSERLRKICESVGIKAEK